MHALRRVRSRVEIRLVTTSRGSGTVQVYPSIVRCLPQAAPSSKTDVRIILLPKAIRHKRADRNSPPSTAIFSACFRARSTRSYSRSFFDSCRTITGIITSNTIINQAQGQNNIIMTNSPSLPQDPSPSHRQSSCCCPWTTLPPAWLSRPSPGLLSTA